MPTTAQISNTFNNVHFVLLQVVEGFSETLIFLPVCEQDQCSLTFQRVLFGWRVLGEQQAGEDAETHAGAED